LAELGKNLGSQPLENVHLLVFWVIDDELVQARLTVATDHVLERVNRIPWVV
jgi:hypothetical protein